MMIHAINAYLAIWLIIGAVGGFLSARVLFKTNTGWLDTVVGIFSVLLSAFCIFWAICYFFNIWIGKI